MYLRTVKVPSSSGKVNEYVRIVEAYRQDGKVRQRVVADLGRKDVLAALLPRLQRLLAGENAMADQVPPSELKVLEAATWGPMLLVRSLAQQLGLPALFQRVLKSVAVEDKEDEPRAAPPAERALVLIAHRLIRPGSEHALAGWLESDWVCDTAGRRFVRLGDGSPSQQPAARTGHYSSTPDLRHRDRRSRLKVVRRCPEVLSTSGLRNYAHRRPWPLPASG